MAATKILVLSNNNLFRQCLASALQAADSTLLVTCKATEFSQNGTPQDLIVLDLCPDQVAALEKLAQVVRGFPTTAILALGMPSSESEVLGFLEVGATEYVSKEESLDELRNAISRALRGDTRCPPELARAAFDRLRELSRQRSQPDRLSGAMLTRRERQILDLISTGLSNKEIAKELHLSLHTVKNHVHRILEKLEVKNRYEAVQFLQKERMVS